VQPNSRPAITYVLQAYGRTDVLQGAYFNILTFVYHISQRREQFHVVVYTDQPAFYSRLQFVECVFMSPEQIREWRGKDDFVHRLKINVLLNAAERFGTSLLYCDSDTYFLNDPSVLLSRISEDASLMHLCEGALSKIVHPNLHRFLAQRRVPCACIPGGIITEHAAMWNAGVLGIHRTRLGLLRDVLDLTDRLYQIYFDRAVVEQFAFSLVLGSCTDLAPADDIIYHYWRGKSANSFIIADFFDRTSGLSIEEAAGKAVELDPRDPPEPKRTIAFATKEFFRRLKHSIRKRAEHIKLMIRNK
jgi:hypothetical protein